MCRQSSLQQELQASSPCQLRLSTYRGTAGEPQRLLKSESLREGHCRCSQVRLADAHDFKGRGGLDSGLRFVQAWVPKSSLSTTLISAMTGPMHRPHCHCWMFSRLQDFGCGMISSSCHWVVRFLGARHNMLTASCCRITPPPPPPHPPKFCIPFCQVAIAGTPNEQSFETPGNL